jgi:hypothetical protein
MIHRTIRGFCLSLLFALSVGSVEGADAPDFSGNWVFRLGNRPLLVLTVSRVAGKSRGFEGSLTAPNFSYQSGSGLPYEIIYAIKGPVVQKPIVRSEIKNDCLALTTQNPANEKDEDNYQLCLIERGRGTLGYDFPVDPWPVIREEQPPSPATDWESRPYFLDETDVSNPEMQRICDDDRKDRELPYEKIDWTVVDKADAARRDATRKLMSDGKLHTGADFKNAAYIFQHTAVAPEEFLLAHALAMAAVAKGEASANFIAAETLDRYLQSIHQPQVFGTQMRIENQSNPKEPYNRTLVPNSLRRLLSVPPQATQQEQSKH